MRILIVVPSFNILGGVANHYQGLADFWSAKVSYSFQGKRSKIPAIVTLIPDVLNYIIKIIINRPNIVVLNPSLRPYQLKRESIYFKIAKFLGVKNIVTFIHGWSDETFKEIKQHPQKFNKTFGESTFIYVLCSDFKKKLESLNIKSPVLLTTTKVKDSLLDNYNNIIRDGKIKTILFLARVDKSKGIFTTLDTFRLLKNHFPYLRLSICGDGPALLDAKEYVRNHEIQDVTFYGNVSGNDLIKCFSEADLYLLPTMWGEGMATSVLEAMAFGLPIITRPIGGVKDFFIENEMGYLVESINPHDYVSNIEKLLRNPDLVKKISETNHNYAISHFLASSVTKKIEQDLTDYSKR